jgi:DNA-binding CsgD family transcriptional regulator
MSTPAFHDGAGAHPVDAIVAGQFGQIPHQEGRTSEEAEALWLNRVTGLLAYQYQDVAKTKATAMVWSRREPVAVLGVISEPTFPGIQAAVDDYAEALFRLHQTESLRQEMDALRHVIGSWRQPLMVARGDGSIIAGTDGGWDALYSYLHRRPSKKNPVIRLPDTMAAMVKNGVQINLGKLDMAVSVLPDCDRETVWPLFVVTLWPKAGVDAPSFEDRLRTLTQSQRAVYQRMILGLRNKEIAAELAISVHTVVHHTTAVLAKMGCQDRLQLMAAAAQSVPRKELTAPLMVIDAPTKPDHKVSVAPEQAG